MLSVGGLTKAFGGLIALRDVSFRVEAGSITGLIGPNGSGKTVTFDCITGFYRPDAGRVRLDGRDITGLRPPAVARAGIGRSFQITGVFPRLTVEQNVAFATRPKGLAGILGTAVRDGDAAAVADRVDRALALVGLDPVRGEAGGTLPYGQQKLLELASLVVMDPDPRLYLLDEPFAGLTAGEISGYLALMHRLKTLGKTFLIVEHNMRVIMDVCDWLVVLDHGEKIAEGRPPEVQSNARVVEAYLGHARAARRS